MLKKMLELEGIKLLNKREQNALSGGDDLIGTPCFTDDDCCQGEFSSLPIPGGVVCGVSGICVYAGF